MPGFFRQRRLPDFQPPGTIFHLDWKARQIRIAWLCLPAVALTLLAGLLGGHPAGGLVAASGAMSVGFGALQRFSRGWAMPMLVAMLGMAASAAAGSLAGHWLPLLLLLSGLWAAGCGLLTAVGTGAWWLGLQWNIALAVASAFPSSLEHALGRGGLILVGGALQWVILVACRRALPAPQGWPSDLQIPELLESLRLLVSRRNPDRAYALRLACAAMGAVLASRLLDLPNGYWAPMTAVMVLKPRLDETYSRGLQRVAGTLLGAGGATLLAAMLRPGPWALALLVLSMAWASYALQRVNYAALSTAISAYVVFLLALVAMPEPEAASHRILATLAGSGLAFAVDLLGWLWAGREGGGGEAGGPHP
ncbi:FUSC family protein [Roseomonas gilardii subsp. gilardii]|uniref:FUSC family protein n=1 Tax=Roseomonas gilardii TaxID=257708 RepID=UPI001FF7A962|nr:FUSC family protein [Roseomonas gilardii]UPG74204.1 FUSC family protein [Roseomonas gilardii subsp. gilardii]